MATAVRVPAATWVGMEIATVNGKRTAFPLHDPIHVYTSAQQEVIWYCADPASDVTIEFPNGSPFIKRGPFLVKGEDSVGSGPVAPNTPFCTQCPDKPKPHQKGHYKYVIRDTKTKEILADPEVIIRN